MSVVEFKPKGHAPSDATRGAIEAEFERMAAKYGCFEVMTVAAYLLAIAIERTFHQKFTVIQRR